jgi:(R)-2-hydroxyacyl-CoA dehydratese activating ATPase
MVFVGVDVGSSATKVALLDNDKILLGWSVQRSGTDFSEISGIGLKQAFTKAGLVLNYKEIKTISTGYGRKNVLYSDGDKTEISCHAKGCYHFFPQAITIIDIGGQDNKIIQVDEKGRRVNFKMNRKCAAGTGAFLEEMALRLNIPLAEMDGLARQSKEVIELGSFCTVFTATEVLEKIRQGKKVPDIVKGLFLSIIKRVFEMDLFGDRVIMTGGVVAFNPFLKTMLEEFVHRPVWVPEYPQLTGAIGAALIAREAFLS